MLRRAPSIVYCLLVLIAVHIAGSTPSFAAGTAARPAILQGVDPWARADLLYQHAIAEYDAMTAAAHLDFKGRLATLSRQLSTERNDRKANKMVDAALQSLFRELDRLNLQRSIFHQAMVRAFQALPPVIAGVYVESMHAQTTICERRMDDLYFRFVSQMQALRR